MMISPPVYNVSFLKRSYLHTTAGYDIRCMNTPSDYMRWPKRIDLQRAVFHEFHHHPCFKYKYTSLSMSRDVNAANEGVTYIGSLPVTTAPITVVMPFGN